MKYKICHYKNHNGERTLPIDNFFKDKTRKDGYDKQCKLCRKIIYRTRVDSDPELARKKTRERQYDRLQHDSDYRDAQRQIRYSLMPKHAAKRRAAKLQATPMWYEVDQVDKLYKDRLRKTNETGVMHNVDHIVPLISDKVCGLHCMDNLQILTEKENKKKSNNF